MKSAAVAVGIYVLACLVGGTIANLFLFVGDSIARGVPLPPDWLIGVVGFNIFSFWYAALGLIPIIIAAMLLQRFAKVRPFGLTLSMAVLGLIIGEWMTSDNFWKNYRYLHIGGVSGAVTAALWTWLTFRERARPLHNA